MDREEAMKIILAKVPRNRYFYIKAISLITGIPPRKVGEVLRYLKNMGKADFKKDPNDLRKKRWIIKD